MTDQDAIDNYLLWELCKREGIQKRISQGSPEEDLKEEIVERVRREYREAGYDRDEKLELLRELDSNPDYREKVFQNCSWTEESVKVEKLGTTLPRFGGLPPEVISGKLSEVVEFVKNADPEEYRSVDYIMSLREYSEILNEFLPWVVTPGNRDSKRERMDRVHGGKDWNIADTWGMINDGNHRTIAKIIANDTEEIECFVGFRRNN